MPEEDAVPALDMMNYGMYVIGSRGPMGRNVMAAHWLMQISFKPRMVALSLENDARTLANVRETRVFSVNVMGEDSRDLIVSPFFNSYEVRSAVSVYALRLNPPAVRKRSVTFIPSASGYSPGRITSP